MNHKERVLKALNNDMPDRVPFFYWDVPEFGEKMMSYYGFTNRDQLLEHLDVDFRWVEPKYIGPQLVEGNKQKKVDIWGVGYSRIKTGKYEYWEADKKVPAPRILPDELVHQKNLIFLEGIH